jgi:hypothetical protein
MTIDVSKLASVIFDRGQKITQSSYNMICESIENERFTLDEYVIDYKSRDKVLGRLAFKLSDGTTMLVEEYTVKKLITLNIDRTKLSDYMSSSESNFKKVVGKIYGDI